MKFGMRFLLIFSLIAFGCLKRAEAFDTFWHSAATSAAGRQLGFTDDAINIVQFGNFSGPDFFGPLYDTVLGERIEKVEPKAKKAVNTLSQFMGFRNAGSNRVVRKLAIFLHFDNIYGRLDSNWKFDYLFLRLLRNTQDTIAAFYNDGSIPPLHKKLLILMTLGASVHVVQDFYSHSDWTHQDFGKLGFSLVRLPWGKDRDPTWFEVKTRLGSPNDWPFKVASGVYPSPKNLKEIQDTWLGVPMTHDAMNHDNSQLLSKELFHEAESQIEHHHFGPFPTKPGDEGSAKEHQLFSANTAAGGTIEWIQKVMETPGARSAIESCRAMKFGSKEPALTFLTQAMGSALFMSCVPDKWDGPKPPPKRLRECRGIYLVAGGAAPADIIPGAGVPGFYGGVIPSPYNLFWGMHVKYGIVERLAKGFSDQSGQYVFDYNWWRSQK